MADYIAPRTAERLTGLTLAVLLTMASAHGITITGPHGLIDADALDYLLGETA